MILQFRFGIEVLLLIPLILSALNLHWSITIIIASIIAALMRKLR